MTEHPGQPTVSKGRLRHKDGEWRFIESSCKLLPTGEVLGNFRDVTRRRQLEDDLRRLNEAGRLRLGRPALWVGPGPARRLPAGTCSQPEQALCSLSTQATRPRVWAGAGNAAWANPFPELEPISQIELTACGNDLHPHQLIAKHGDLS
jgi:hypothetical protein